ncbi:MAG: orc1/cdc6 family replication initiation protein [Bauldia sp.]|nr:orc1/cdc6 family replication initiation protein [Bauldia sp.]MCW5717077.1 orc1/cdc6 family replication initiation protein [Bauldia sp.]
MELGNFRADRRPQPRTDEDWFALDFEVQELFTPAAPINEADLFAGRIEQIRRLIEAVSERGRHAILFGERGVGKTSLANTFHMIIKRAVNRQVYPIRKPAGPTDTFSSLWRRVFADIQTQAVVEGTATTVSVSELYNRDITPDDVVREMQSISLNSVPLIIFDEFDKLAEPDSKRLMSHTIKELSDNGANATILIVGVAEDVDRLIEGHASVERNITEIKMPRMSTEELNQILDKRLPRLGMRLKPDARWKIVTLSRGLPTYVHSLGRDSARNAIAARRLTVNEEDVDNAIRELVRTSDQSTTNAFHKATHSNKKNALYRHVLTAAALAKTDDEGRFVAVDVVEPLSRVLGRRVAIANFHAHLNGFCDLERGGILEKKGTTQAFRYRFREPKMQPFVIMRGIADGMLSPDAMAILSAPEQPRLSNDF